MTVIVLQKVVRSRHGRNWTNFLFPQPGGTLVPTKLARLPQRACRLLRKCDNAAVVKTHSGGANENRTSHVFRPGRRAAMVLQAGAAQAAMKTQWIDYKQGNTALSGYLVYDDAVQGRRPGVLMIHDRSGFSEGTLADAQMIAKLGYVVFAEDMFGKGIVPKDVPEMTKLIRHL